MINLNIPTAVLIIDVQNVMFDENYPVHDSLNILKNIKKIENYALDHKLLTIYLQHAGGVGSPEEFGTEGWKLHPELSINGEVIGKREFEAFKSTKLNLVLKENKIEQVIICGMQSDYCIQANSRASVESGYKTILVKDAHSTCDSEEKSGKEIISSINSELESSVKLISTEELIQKN